MLKWLTGKKSVTVWAIKQIDDGLLHLCGQARIEARGKRSEVLSQIASGCFEGPVNMASNGLILNARQFAALIPLEDLELDSHGTAHWQGRIWDLAQVPQRCWTFDGRLTVQRQVQDGQVVLTSTEDVSDIRRQAHSSNDPGVVKFGIYGAEEHPLLTPKEHEVRPAPSHSNRSREWHGDDDER
ncbi:hypothetical protein [Billgrantia gudaonensis]|uniref:Uncharacterized protein n=1 Tax=Billgrantia gudaonensis TaxID=376427 RepID=A0A1G8X169_9GAMM|nr:hypothetical protein [Halomonas gudaonensis]SDJ84056.1 hypothetical protein SAMN04487954_108158 [Halomonas gudaonensis]